jgi:lipopolysaccharide export LptBFGC system permease protein LptF
MNPIATSAIILACVFGGGLAGMFLRSRLPSQHMQDDSKDIVKLGTGVVATMAALVLGLLVSSAKGSFDKTSDEVTLGAAKIVQLNRALAQYGDETKEIRGALRRYAEAVADALTSGDKFRLMQLRAPASKTRADDIEVAIRALVPRSEAQRELRSLALTLMQEASANRSLLLLQQHSSVSTPLLVVVVAWFALIFLGFGLFSPRNGTVLATLFLCALAVSGALFLILEMDTPLEGMIRISDGPTRNALSTFAID